MPYTHDTTIMPWCEGKDANATKSQSKCKETANEVLPVT